MLSDLYFWWAGTGVHLFSILGDNEKIRFKNSDLFIDPINVYSRY